MIALLFMLGMQAVPQGSSQAPVLNPHATELFERDAQLNAWAVRVFDRNRDGWLTLYEAQPALQVFREIADADRNGRVTVREYQAAKAFIAARWGPPRE